MTTFGEHIWISQIMNEKMKTFMRVVLDEMPHDPYPLASGEQAAVAGYDHRGNLMVS